VIWEYKTCRLTANVSSTHGKELNDLVSTMEGTLNSAGREGWELVSTFDTEVTGYNKFILAIFKRPQQ
jgi:hypothetical protein